MKTRRQTVIELQKFILKLYTTGACNSFIDEAESLIGRELPRDPDIDMPAGDW